MINDDIFIPHEDQRAFRDALGRFATGVTLVTISGPNGAMGFTANSFAAVSLDPPLVLWSPAKASSRFAVFVAAKHYAIHILTTEQHGLIKKFTAHGTGFADIEHTLNPEGAPVLPDVLARFDCVQEAVHDGGDHVIIVGKVLRAMHKAGDGLIFAQGKYGQFVHKP